MQAIESSNQLSMAHDLQFVSRSIVEISYGGGGDGGKGGLLHPNTAAPAVVERDVAAGSGPTQGRSTAIGSLYEQLEANREVVTTSVVRTSNSLMPKKLDEEDVAFLDEQELAKQRKEALLHEQRESDSVAFELAFAASRTTQLAPAVAPDGAQYAPRIAARGALIKPGLGAAPGSTASVEKSRPAAFVAIGQKRAREIGTDTDEAARGTVAAASPSASSNAVPHITAVSGSNGTPTTAREHGVAAAEAQSISSLPPAAAGPAAVPVKQRAPPPPQFSNDTSLYSGAYRKSPSPAAAQPRDSHVGEQRGAPGSAPAAAAAAGLVDYDEDDEGDST